MPEKSQLTEGTPLPGKENRTRVFRPISQVGLYMGGTQAAAPGY